MEKELKIRIIGSASSEKKEQAKKEIEQALFNHFESLSKEDREEMEKIEYPKFEKELAFINFANKEVSKLMKEAGLESYDIPLENYHIIPPEFYKRAGGHGDAIAFSTKQGILFDAYRVRNNPVNFGTTVFHETLHLKAHFSIEVNEEDEKINKTFYRERVTINALQSHGYHGKYHRHFAGLHEAIVTETEKRFLLKLLDQPELASEKTWLISNKAKGLRKKIANEEEIPEDDIFWVGKKEENDWESVSYLPQRNVLNYICSEIHKQFPDEYQSTDDVYKLFLNAHFSGRLLPLARLIEKTFGEGSFRLLGNMEIDRQSGILHLESLKKARARQIKGK